MIKTFKNYLHTRKKNKELRAKYASEASSLLKDSVLSVAFEDVELSILERWLDSSATDTDGREAAWHRLKSLYNVREQLQYKIEDAKIEQYNKSV